MCPGSDLMPKAIINDPNVINIITTALLNVQNDYVTVNPEWDNGTRSYVVLEAKSSVMSHPPIIIEIQHTINSLFIKRFINYSLEAFKRYNLDPIVPIVCTDALSDYVAKNVKSSNIPSCNDFPSTGWASRCLIVSKACIQESIDTIPVDPFVALNLFLTSRAVTINDTLYADDYTIQFLYILTLKKTSNSARRSIYW
ncbi:hypothetical protein BCV72DRAFT_284144 [Rhizopus microsporus var. microsporus]|uniref:Uncharacterized protein n=2 Tax=Rhizopus microsporus TaxID=58291 RepID=A0A2G4STV9_RHIZD|nr:uncharacterized protein RHIMIDRAFT_306980 [Rhizopus microsporus ATCC 52813]ORE11500.1 hypothetical protein BCV72DRAFT_284144 [Rhizopus microsporus var. microsporus]PHZ12200.1 hypothetical protein RHIMIDRAFT_306980 [Rhizopus microsporus ATCC 52813]